jgi:2-isopropylmalate synthase
MRPEDVGLARNSLVLGKHSGRHAFRDRVQQLGFQLDELELNRVFEEFKALADKKKELFDGDIEALVLKSDHADGGPWSIERMWTSATSGSEGSAVVRLKHTDGRAVEQGATGDGPIDAAFKAIELATGTNVKLTKFELRSVSEGEDAQGEALVCVEHEGRSYRGTSVSTNIIESSARAFIEVINRVQTTRQNGRLHPQPSAQTREAQAAV